MNAKRIIGNVLVGITGGLIAVFIFALFFYPETENTAPPVEKKSMRYVNLPGPPQGQVPDFTYAAEKTVHAVVHVKTKTLRESPYSGSGNPFYDFFFGDRYYRREPTPVTGYGSGVILTDDGYIVTNNHVIQGSQAIEVILNDKRAYDASVIGTDPSTDLAVIKIEEQGLPSLEYGNSDILKLGEWVLAVGNPYNLTSTVTAGIVSAKARNINILTENFAIESFIQTDAAVNPGNSGGALVNVRGELVGVNAAIASRTGSYSGNSFAIPVSLVKKVVGDIIEYGVVQRAILGVTITELTAELAEKNNIDDIKGVLITGIREDGAAEEAGIKSGDVILEVNGARVNSPSGLQEQVSRYKPGDEVSVRINRNNRIRQFDVVLRNMEGNTGKVIKTRDYLSVLGAAFESLSEMEMEKLEIEHGVRVVGLKSGKFRSAGIREGFIVTKINNQPVRDVDDIEKILDNFKGGVYVEGIYPDGLIAYYAFGL